MVTNWQSRTQLLIGKEALVRLSSVHVLVVGLGGVGAYVAEMLCRSGVGELTLVDGDVFTETNLNRQLPALRTTLGKPKTEVLAERLLSINPNVKLHLHSVFLRDELTTELLQKCRYDFVVDAIDTLSPKVFLLYHALQNGLRVVSSMGSAGKMDPSQVKIADISKSEYCRLAKMVRKRLHKLGVKRGITVVYSTETVVDSAVVLTKDEEPNKNSTVGTISYMPAVFGCFLASFVIRELIKSEKE
ncbi:MAG: tRNA threonylcarbamoyladenosine dehydratase [Paludibacteraceae bacterium]|nr:tRNA threonylcarbamoyladenosine dehydratase [Paludibacteraceae bacterium]